MLFIVSMVDSITVQGFSVMSSCRGCCRNVHIIHLCIYLVGYEPLTQDSQSVFPRHEGMAEPPVCLSAFRSSFCCQT